MQRGRIKENLSDPYKELALPAIISSYRRLFDDMMYANKAHTEMLYDCGIIELDTAQQILTALEDIHNGLKESGLSVDRGDDLYMNVESHLIDRIGADQGGRMHTARSRNDLMSTLGRMGARKNIWESVESVIELQEMLLKLAADNKDTVFTGYTHMQPAQPTTVAHYLIMCINSLSRDVKRLRAAYDNANRCSLGAAAFAGTGFSIDRQQTSNLLGFEKIIDNSWDCVVSRDYIMELESAYTILENSLSRIAQDIFIWCTDEFNIWELGGQVSGQSSIMPQKKNPSSLEYVKSGCSSGIGAFVSSNAALKNCAFSFVCDHFRLETDMERAQNDLLFVLETMKETIKYSSIHKERAEIMAEKNFCTATGLADILARDFNISFRNAHHIVGGMVGDAKAKNEDVTGITCDMLRSWSKQILGYEIDMPDKALRNALSAKGNVESKLSVGGPSADMVETMLAKAEKDISSECEWLNESKAEVQKAYDRINEKACEIINQ